MKKIIKIAFASLVIGAFSCVNQDWEFPDFDKQTVYFAHQYPVRTITLGEDIFDTSLDNERKFRIMATTGGVYTNRQDLRLEIEVDPSLSNNLLFSEGGDEVLTLPSEYYQLAASHIIIPKGEIIGGVEIQLTGAFFNDPNALKNTYVVPLRIKSVDNADSVLVGRSTLANPNPHVIGDWDVIPKDFVLYAIKYVNEWHGIYLRRGKDTMTGKPGFEGLSKEVVRRREFVEQDELKSLHTESLSTIQFPLTIQGSGGENIAADLFLTFDNQGNCTVTSATDGITASGSGSFVKKGEKKSWGNQDRDAIYLQYEINHPQFRLSAVDTLVMRNRGVGLETFNPVLK
ncbi:adhesin [Rhodonellum psychrophilum GCM71 = DSM 17998]|uniref:Adhesin n=2 Tax=Rhodonellum TaxID=336827 RepID=U5C198_9BACT|nr:MULTISPECIES: DUF5627 domain-containing protein [Rhodonellum]ERM83584.1 adhesin [Rhodonellum psychrophilum GCM71 = DSM 17998]SDY48819.1 protein of unknown function [Rhodonellum ikkaensis]